MKKKAVVLTVMIIIYASYGIAADAHKNGYKGTFKKSAIVVRTLFECQDYVQHVSAGDESFGGNLAYAGRLDVFDTDDSFIIIDRVGGYIKLVGHHKSGHSVGTNFEGWILDEWLYDAEEIPRPSKKPRSNREEKKPSKKAI